jgi:Zn-dependent M28 family amino/carboxypeptidase
MRIPAHLALAAALAAFAAPALAQNLKADVAKVSEKALADTTGWDVLESLTSEVGARPVGTPAMDRARDWGVAKLKALGFQNVKVETFTTPAWTRGPVEIAEIVGPWPHKLSILQIGGSTATPPGGITAEIAVFKTYQDLLNAPVGSLKGKIAIVTEKMALINGYGPAGPIRRVGAVEAAKRGAVAYMLRSLSSADTRLPHTGTGASGGIPAIALSTPDAELIDRLADRGKPITIKLVTTATFNPNATAYNISGEIPGTTDEVVIIGGHLDSWDPGTGAVDDGSGIAITTAAAKMAASVGGKPRRTIRVMMWGSEEQEGSSTALLAARRSELGKIVVTGESDSGPGAPYATAVPKGSLSHPAMQAYAAVVPTLRVAMSQAPSAGGGSDIAGIVGAGVPSVNINVDGTLYMKLHHSADDTLDKVDPQALALNVATWASFIHAVAYSDVDFRKLAAGSK